jgi:hypothetical protein
MIASKILPLLALSIWISACQKWVEVGPPVEALHDQASMPAQYREVLRVHLVDPDGVVDGTVEEIAPDSVTLATNGDRATFAFASVSRVETRHTNWVPIIIGGAVLIAAFWVGYAVWMNNYEGPYICCY